MTKKLWQEKSSEEVVLKMFKKNSIKPMLDNIDKRAKGRPQMLIRTHFGITIEKLPGKKARLINTFEAFPKEDME